MCAVDSKFQVNEEYRKRLNPADMQKRFFVLNRIFLRVKRELLELEEEDYDEIERVPGLKINHAILYGSIQSYFYDVFRLRDFHSSEDGLINRPKKAAYIIKWLVNDKPIYFESDAFSDPVTCHLLLFVNELVAFRAGLGYAGVPLKLVDEETTDKFVYNLAFRPSDEGMMSLWFDSFLNANGLPLQ